MHEVSYAGWNVCQNVSLADMAVAVALVLPVHPVAAGEALLCRRDTVLAVVFCGRGVDGRGGDGCHEADGRDRADGAEGVAHLFHSRPLPGTGPGGHSRVTRAPGGGRGSRLPGSFARSCAEM